MPVVSPGDTFSIPVIELLRPRNVYTSIFNYFFTLHFVFAIIMIPVKATIRLFRR